MRKRRSDTLAPMCSSMLRKRGGTSGSIWPRTERIAGTAEPADIGLRAMTVAEKRRRPGLCDAGKYTTGSGSDERERYRTSSTTAMTVANVSLFVERVHAATVHPVAPVRARLASTDRRTTGSRSLRAVLRGRLARRRPCPLRAESPSSRRSPRSRRRMKPRPSWIDHRPTRDDHSGGIPPGE